MGIQLCSSIDINKAGMAANLHLTPQFHWISFFSIYSAGRQDSADIKIVQWEQRGKADIFTPFLMSFV